MGGGGREAKDASIKHLDAQVTEVQEAGSFLLQLPSLLGSWKH